MSAEALLNNFLDSSVAEGGELNTQYLMCPELSAAPASITKWDVKTGTFTDKKTGEERQWAILQLTWNIDSEEAREATKRDEVNVNQSVSLSLTSEGKLDTDNNQTLGRLAKMFDLDIGTSVRDLFNSFIGQFAYVKVTHRALTNKAGEALLDEEGNQRYSAEVTGVGKDA